jgi:hypothetical protein
VRVIAGLAAALLAARFLCPIPPRHLFTSSAALIFVAVWYVAVIATAAVLPTLLVTLLKNSSRAEPLANARGSETAVRIRSHLRSRDRQEVVPSLSLSLACEACATVLTRFLVAGDATIDMWTPFAGSNYTTPSPPAS